MHHHCGGVTGEREPALDPVEEARASAELLRNTGSRADVADLLSTLADIVEAERRRAVRFGFDLHDGALQEVAMLGAELHVFREQVGSAAAFDDRRRIVGRVDDLIARLAAIHDQLRELATSAEAVSLLSRPLSATLAEIVGSFNGQIEIQTSIDPNLNESALTDSQKIAVVRIVGAAVANAAHHSGATRVQVALHQLPDGLEAEICDDGVGFAVDATLSRAAITGRLGLVAMRERARLLGGRLDIESSPGGPTRIVLRLPSWRRGVDQDR